MDEPCLPIEPAFPKARRSRQAKTVWGSRVVTVGSGAGGITWMLNDAGESSPMHVTRWAMATPRKMGWLSCARA